MHKISVSIDTYALIAGRAKSAGLRGATYIGDKVELEIRPELVPALQSVNNDPETAIRMLLGRRTLH